MTSLAHKIYLKLNDKEVPLIYGGKGCFVAGTLIKTEQGYKKIQDVTTNDKVYSFDNQGNLNLNKVSVVYHHKGKQDTILFTLWNNQKLEVTPNHWMLTPDSKFMDACMFDVGDCFVDVTGNFISIVDKQYKTTNNTYNLTVEKDHTYVANDILVHNKGGNKGAASGGTESPNSLFSTDILFLTVGLGEGPVYRVNPNGPQDIEMNEGSIDDFINLDGDGEENNDLFKTLVNTGTLSQDPLEIFGDEVSVPQNFASPITLKKGNIAGIPRTRVFLQNTSVATIDRIRFNFIIGGLFNVNDKGDIFATSTSVKVTILDRTGTTELVSRTVEITGKTNTNYKFQVDITIPEASRSSNGLKFTIEKVNDDSENSRVNDSIQALGWDEITNDDVAYVRTATIGYAVKASSEFSGGLPTITSMVKGLLVKVPSNYNQPILENGDIDWRELEVVDDASATDTNSYQSAGYRLQSTGSTVLTADEPEIYKGIWDGSFVFSWTQNPVWILYDLLTNRAHGLAIPEENIDKYKFYKVAQYCDAVDSSTGKFIGVSGYADGTFRHKPRGKFTSVRETLIGLNEGIEVLNRRFTCNVTISSQDQAFNTLQKIASIFRGVIFYSGGKISLNVDLPDELPVATFSEANIEKDSISISGIRESEIITGVEVAYIEPNNHYRRELVRINDTDLLKEQNHIENIATVEATGCTRRSQAIRFGQYFLANNKFIRRKITFRTNITGINLSVGDVISVSNRMPGTAWGYAGRVASNSSIAGNNVHLEHFTSPAISESTFSSNTNPLALRMVNLNSDTVELYILSDNYTTTSSGNTASGIDLIEVETSLKLNPDTKTFTSTNVSFTTDTVPVLGDLWTLGEIDPSNYLSNLGDKLFKVTNLERDEDEKITIAASEYISNVYIDSDELINYIPVKYEDIISPLVRPPTPILSLNSQPRRKEDGSIGYDIHITATTDSTNYPILMETELEYASASEFREIDGIL